MMRKWSPPAYFLFYLAAAIALIVFFPDFKVIHPPFTYLGIPLIIFGLYLIFRVDFLLKKYQTTVKPFEKPSVLITRGPFGFSRHPMYLGFLFWLLGFVILSGNWLALLAPVAIFITLEKVYLPREEENLEKAFGQKYLDYQKKVCRWLGRR